MIKQSDNSQYNKNTNKKKLTKKIVKDKQYI